jgi:hypothetical protein
MTYVSICIGNKTIDVMRACDESSILDSNVSKYHGFTNSIDHIKTKHGYRVTIGVEDHTMVNGRNYFHQI